MSNIEPVLLEKAREMYMNYTPITEIARQLSIGRSTLQYHAGKAWKQEREIFSAELLSNVADNKKAALSKIAGKSIELMMRALDDIDRKEVLTAHDANVVMNLFEKLDKVLKLDAGQATDIVADAKPSTVIEVRERLALDPFNAPLIEDVTTIQGEINEETDTVNINRDLSDELSTVCESSEQESSKRDSSN